MLHRKFLFFFSRELHFVFLFAFEYSLANLPSQCKQLVTCLFMFVLIFSGPVHAMVLERHDAISHWRALIGPTDARKAKTSHPNRLKLQSSFFSWEHLCEINDNSNVNILTTSSAPLGNILCFSSPDCLWSLSSSSEIILLMSLNVLALVYMLVHFMLLTNNMLLITALERCADWTLKRTVCMVQIHCNLQPEKFHFSSEMLNLVSIFAFVSYKFWG